jgi:hypothetical protein
MNILLIDTTGGNPAFYGIVRDPDLGALALTTGAEWAEAFVQKQLGFTSQNEVDCWTDSSGQIYTWGYSATSSTNMQGYYYLQGWTDLREEFS